MEENYIKGVDNLKGASLIQEDLERDKIAVFKG